MKKKTNKKTDKSLDLAVVKNEAKNNIKKTVKKPEKKESVVKIARFAKTNPKTLKKASVKPNAVKSGRKIDVRSRSGISRVATSHVSGKTFRRLSSEFAIAVILIVAGFFTFLLMKDSPGSFFINSKLTKGMTDSVSQSSAIPEIKSDAIRSDNAGYKWKQLRNETAGNEFKIPASWKPVEFEGAEKFVSEFSKEEIVIVNEKNDKGYDERNLLEEVLKNDKQANAMPLKDQRGILIEKRDGEKIIQTAKMILGSSIVSVTYTALGGGDTNFFIEMIIPTFRAL